jgi:membrane protein YqaA with SNARE-associated domain
MDNIEHTSRIAGPPAPDRSAARPAESPPAGNTASPLRAIASFLLAITISVAVMWLTSRFHNEIESLGNAGLIGLFALSVLGNATLIIPAPVFVFACAAGMVFSFPAVGLVAGLGAALGELTGYMAGYGGTAVVPRGRLYQNLQRFMQRRGMIAIFLLAAIPNPIFDVGGILAGVIRMPVWKFIVGAWAGKAMRLGMLAFICLSGAPWLRQIFGLE